MKFGFEQRWEASVDDVLAVYTDEAFWSSMAGLSKTNPPEVLGVDRHAGRVVVRLRFRLSVDLPSQASRFIDPDDVAWVEEHDWDLDGRRADVRFLPEQASALIRASAGSTLTQDGVDTVRQVRGEVKVRIPLVGSRVERAIVDGIGDHLTEEADAVETRLG